MRKRPRGRSPQNQDCLLASQSASNSVQCAPHTQSTVSSVLLTLKTAAWACVKEARQLLPRRQYYSGMSPPLRPPLALADALYAQDGAELQGRNAAGSGVRTTDKVRYCANPSPRGKPGSSPRPALDSGFRRNDAPSSPWLHLEVGSVASRRAGETTLPWPTSAR